MNEALKPCPFCGGESKWHTGLVGCKSCGIWSRNEQCWNTRAPVELPWTPIASGLPAEPGWYLVMLAPGNDWNLMSDTPLQVEFDAFTTMPQAFTYSDGWYDGPQDISDAVTHWMPLPSAPEVAA
ncbi:hypothetical protein WI89_00970 [Burkholderia ubonensis]|uniref:DUF551 domain-containing protein n=1 Tax=Burkholderia ubonensis TaxID=101571 RepID=UPI0007571BFA|nr:DUF551 domain-containing protein [Burkholderia ubonensis]KVD71825.1 hypothetical protein WI89_00970 [Burkholderia ubonensis]